MGCNNLDLKCPQSVPMKVSDGSQHCCQEAVGIRGKEMTSPVFENGAGKKK